MNFVRILIKRLSVECRNRDSIEIQNMTEIFFALIYYLIYKMS